MGGYEIGKGGGIVGGFQPFNPFRGWRHYTVAASYVDPDGLEFPVIRFRKNSGPVTDTIAQVQGRVQTLFIEKTWPMGGGLLRGQYPTLGWYVMDPSTLAYVAGPLTPVGNVALGNLSQETREKTPLTDHVLQWDSHTVPTGPFILALVSRDPSVEHPLWISGHPVEIVTDCLTRKGEDYETASATAATASLGTMLHHQMAVTDADQTPQELIDTLSEAYGFSVRRSAVSGKAEFVHWRKRVQTLPTTVITTDHLREEGGPTYDLSDATRVSRVRVTGEVISLWQSGLAQRVEKTLTKGFGGAGRVISSRKRQRAIAKAAYLDSEKPASGLLITSADITYDYSTDGVTADSDVYGEADVEISLNGMPAVSDAHGGGSPLNLEQWAEGVARMLFSPASRGRQMARVRCRRHPTTSQALLGEFVTLDVGHSPNAQLGQSPTSQRGGQRPFRVVEHTPELSGPDLLLTDEGTGVQYTEVPDISVALDTSTPGQWLVTVNNAAQLTADGAQVEFQVLVFWPGDTPSFTDPGFRYTVDDATTWPDDPMVIRMGPFPIGHQVHFRASAWLFDSAASDWSAWDGLGGGGVTGSISALTQGTTTSSSVAYTWTNTNSSALVRVLLKLDTETDYSLVIDLPAGSTAYTLTGLIAETDYDVRVVLVQGGTETGTALTDSFTTDLVANQSQLSTPTDVMGFGGYSPVDGSPSPGLYGLQVRAVFGPPDMAIVYEVATETAIGSGTPGAYSIAAKVPAVVGDVTRYSATVGNDQKLRFLRAYAIAASWDDSTMTSAVAVDPWPDIPVDSTAPLLTPPTASLRLFGWAPDVVVASAGSSYTDEQAQDAVGAMVDGTTLEYVDATPLLRVKDAGITLAKIQDVSTARILGRDTAGSGVVEQLTAAEVLAMLGSSPSPGAGLPYMYPFADAIDWIGNDNFALGDGAGGMDTSGTRRASAQAWTALNSPTTTTIAEGRLNIVSASSASVQIRGYHQAVPSGNYCVRMNVAIRPNQEVGGQRAVGLFLRDSTSSKCEVWSISNDTGGGPMLWAAKMTNATTFSATRIFSSFGVNQLPHFLEIEYDGTNYYMRWGWYDAPLTRHLSFAKTDFLTVTADQIGVFSANWESDATTLISRGFYRVPVSSLV